MRIEFGRAVCGELAAAEQREWLVTNGLGGFASGTIAGTLTRRYHGLLFAAFNPPVDRMLLVTKIDEIVRYAGQSFELAANRWCDGYVSPCGYTSIERFFLDGTMPVWEYALADALLEKRVWMEPGANRSYVRYRVLRSASPLDLSLRVFVNYRDFHGNTHAGDWHVGVTAEDERRLRVDAVSSGRPFWIASDAGGIAVENVWYRDFVLAQETLRGLDDRDDNLAAGSVSVTLAAGESVTVTASDQAVQSVGATEAIGRRVAHETAVTDAYERSADVRPTARDGESTADGKRPAWIRQCVLAADQFVVAHPVETDPQALSVVAGYHWFGDWGRDAMIALPGLALTTGRGKVARSILTTFSSFVDGGMLPNFFPERGQLPEYNTVDAALWYVETAARYVEATGDDATLRTLWPSLQQVVESYRSGTRYGIHMDADGLIVASAPGVQLTWMDAKVGDRVITPRMGKPVEIAALWYNALMRMQGLATRLGNARASGYAELAKTARAGFERFWNSDAGYCCDVVDGPNGNDASMRPNQLFAVALPHAALSLERARPVVDACGAQLVTSSGMRSLAPSDPRFVPSYRGSPSERDAAYHQGTAWAWLLGAFRSRTRAFIATPRLRDRTCFRLPTHSSTPGLAASARSPTRRRRLRRKVRSRKRGRSGNCCGRGTRFRQPHRAALPPSSNRADMLLQRYWTDPFAYLGMHREGNALVLRTSQPRAERVRVRTRDGKDLGALARLDDDGLYEIRFARRRKPFDYVLDVGYSGGSMRVEDPYRFGPLLGDVDAYLIAEGNHLQLWRVLGAHCRTIDGVAGTAFAVWAPNALRVSVVGDFNEWDGRYHPMRKRVECGVWEIFIPGVAGGARYKFEIERAEGGLLALKADPLARYAEHPPATASIVEAESPFAWTDAAWMERRGAAAGSGAPISIYEVHLGSWRRRAGEGNRYLTYAELAAELLPYVAEMGFTHVEMLPVTEHPFDGSWGYQPTGMFAPTSRYGTPNEFRRFVDTAHRLGIGVILDWVPGHFPTDPHGLAFFDGTYLYEYGDPRKGFQPDWNTLIYNHGRREVANFLVASALYWIEEFHVDGLRVDAVASMLYLDYSRREGQWVPNARGGRENLDAIEFLKRLNQTMHDLHGDAVTIAEESTSWPLVTGAVADGGLGFDYKWNMGWMHDSLRYLATIPCIAATTRTISRSV